MNSTKPHLVPEATETAEPAGWQLPLLDLAICVTRHPILITVTVLLAGYMAHKKVTTTPSFYRSSADALLMSREKSTFDANIDTQSLETTEGVGRSGSSAPNALPANSSLYVTLMTSRGCLEQLVEEFKDRLIEEQKLPAKHRSDEFVSDIRRMVEVSGTEDGMLTVTVTALDPELASDIANALFQEGKRISQKIEADLLLEQADVLEETSIATQRDLDDAVETFTTFCQRYGFTNPLEQSQAQMQLIGALERAITDISLDLEVRLQHYTFEDAEVQILQEKLAQRTEQLNEARANIIPGISSTEYAELELRYNSHRDAVRRHTAILATMTTRALLNRIRAGQANGSMVILRDATPKFTPAGPSKTKTLAMYIVGALIVAVGGSIVFEQLRTMRTQPAVDARLGDLKESVLRMPPLRAIRAGRKWLKRSA